MAALDRFHCMSLVTFVNCAYFMCATNKMIELLASESSTCDL